ncbi:ATPase [Salipiger aestuarii]|uniref:F-type H+-transporting ATPase subunit gamma n=1 Tax=Salipiger aestuarii TaxID=568098 RepID=A0A327Y530_9RHOB|nr:FoF1 ATP synthase subunit gamma [Salipiger aestuarii]EIE49003.1 H(+)-transporting ATP synthase, subunit gamma [Citreicella sp. 357]KAA8605296.1 ATPase [Salipiger aestuarii]KAA8607524.1 ATPase [Salipiger aestuarii]KAB2536948.1 ATPase [Salipiger aestuarii]RAK15176.1 F-type H+-transporting ATPase subunit gamma [Salipiger aestuarii]
MTRPEDIRDRIDNIREIESIVSTLRALAVARQHEARDHLAPIRAYETSVAQALGTALAAARITAPEPIDRPGLIVVVGVAQGFSGAFGDRIADAADDHARRGADLLIVGGRTGSALDERGVKPVWVTETASHPHDVPALASRLSDVLFDRLTRSGGAPVSILFADPEALDQPLTRRLLFPFDFSRFPAQRREAPLTTLAAGELVSELIEEYVFTALCEAVMLGFAAENAARATAMSRAQTNVKRIATDLQATFQRARQEQMTTEIIELSTASAP